MKVPCAELLSVGTELLLGEIVDTNAAYLSRALADAGIDVYYKTTVGDNRLRLATAMGIALSRSDILIVTGGLGPTQDDITKEVLAALLGIPLELRADAWEGIQSLLTRRGRPVTENNKRQAMLPQGARLIPNPVGVAPGVWLEHGSKLIVCLPGVPAEMTAMVEESVLPWLKERTASAPLHSKVLRFRDIGESALEHELMDLFIHQTSPTLALYAGSGEVRLRMTCRAASRELAEAAFAPVEQEIRRRVGRYIYATGNEPLERLVGAALRRAGATVAVAESCTGGLIGQRLTSVPGSSDYFLGGIVAYHNDVKRRALGVPAELLEAYGAVSEQVARAMAEGVRTVLGADFGLAVTGIAGPGGGTEEKPVGTVFIGCAAADGARVVHRLFRGTRDAIRQQTADEALYLLLRALEAPAGGNG